MRFAHAWKRFREQSISRLDRCARGRIAQETDLLLLITHQDVP